MELLGCLFCLKNSVGILVLRFDFFNFIRVSSSVIIVFKTPSFSWDFKLCLTNCVFLTVFLMLRGVERIICFTVSYIWVLKVHSGDVPKPDRWRAKNQFFTHKANTLHSDFFNFTLVIMKRLPIYLCIFIFQLDFINIQMITSQWLFITAWVFVFS